MANQADESIKVRATNGANGPTVTLDFPHVSISAGNTWGASIPIDEAEALIERIKLAIEIHKMEAEIFEPESPLKGQRVDIKVGDEVLTGKYVGIRGSKWLVANLGKTKHDYFHLDEVTFTFPDATESAEERFLAIHDGWKPGWHCNGEHPKQDAPPTKEPTS